MLAFFSRTQVQTSEGPVFHCKPPCNGAVFRGFQVWLFLWGSCGLVLVHSCFSHHIVKIWTTEPPHNQWQLKHITFPLRRVKKKDSSKSHASHDMTQHIESNHMAWHCPPTSPQKQAHLLTRTELPQRREHRRSANHPQTPINGRDQSLIDRDTNSWAIHILENGCLFAWANPIVTWRQISLHYIHRAICNKKMHFRTLNFAVTHPEVFWCHKDAGGKNLKVSNHCGTMIPLSFDPEWGCKCNHDQPESVLNHWTCTAGE